MTELTYQAVRHAQDAVAAIVQEAEADGRPIPPSVATMMGVQLVLHPRLAGDPHKLQLAAEVALEIHAETEWSRVAGRFLAN